MSTDRRYSSSRNSSSGRSSSGHRPGSSSGNRRSSGYNGYPGRSTKKKRKFKSSFYFLCFLVAWSALLILLGIIFLGYADHSLKKFEKSQSAYAFEEYMKEFEKSLAAGQLPEGFESENVNPFESSDVVLDTLLTQTQGKTLTYEKNSNSYKTEEPIYDILADGQPIASVTLSAYNEKVTFLILTVMDWKVEKAELINATNLTDYTICAPDGYRITVNGVPVGGEYLTGNRESQALFANASEYITVPDLVEYKIPGLSMQPEVIITDASGQNVNYTLEGTKYTVPFGVESEMPEDLKETALNIAETWSLFNTDDLKGGSHGLETVRKFLIPDSYYDNLAKGWASGVDITFTSAHTLSNPAFENVNVDHYIRYTDDCFSCHIDFDKPMHLTRTGDNIVDSTHSTYLFAKYNGNWCMVDMIADKGTE